MKRISGATAVVILLSFVVRDGRHADTVSSAEGDQHSYFNALVTRADHWKSWSLRSAAQLAHTREGGFAQKADRYWVTYDPSTDTDSHRQDAAKVVIPAFQPPMAWLSKALGAGDSSMPIDAVVLTNFPVGRVFKVDREIMTVTAWLTGTSMSIKRGAFGTTPTAHDFGAPILRATNSLQNQVRLPLDTVDGNSYFFTWDAYWTDSYLNFGVNTHKEFQFSSGGRTADTIWFEPQSAFNGGGDSYRPKCFNPAMHPFAVQYRTYNKENDTITDWRLTDGNMVFPGIPRPRLANAGEFCVKANTWTRFFVRIEQRANDWDYVDAWVADETNEPVQMLRRIPLSVREDDAGVSRIGQFWIEFNASDDDFYRLDQRDAVSYVRNFVALQNTRDYEMLLVRPVPGAKPVPGPAAPRNVRIISGS